MAHAVMSLNFTKDGQLFLTLPLLVQYRQTESPRLSTAYLLKVFAADKLRQSGRCLESLGSINKAPSNDRVSFYRHPVKIQIESGGGGEVSTVVLNHCRNPLSKAGRVSNRVQINWILT